MHVHPDKRRLRSGTVTDRDMDMMLNKLDNVTGGGGTSRRLHKRFPYRVRSLSVHIQQPGNSTPSPFMVQARNISAGGLSFLHGGFVHFGSKCLVQLITQHGAWTDVSGRVVNCRYVEKGIHEVAVEFDEPVRPSDYCSAAMTFEFLLVDDDDAIARLAMHHLAMMNVEVDRAKNGQEAVAACSNKSYDCVLMDMEMPVMDGFDATKALREQGYAGIIVAMTGKARPEDREACLNAGCNHYYAKPASPDVYSSILDLLKHEPITSSFQDDPAMRDFIESFAQALPAEVRKLEEAFAAKDDEALEAQARAIKAQSGSYGFETLGSGAEQLEAAIQNEEPRDQVGKKLAEFITLCMQVRSLDAEAGGSEAAAA